MADYREEFRRLFETTFISGKGSEDRIALEIASFLEKVVPNIPERLFRFRRIEDSKYAVKSFDNDTITVCKANCFSDKYDSLVYVNVDGERAELELHLKKAMQQVMKHIKEKNPWVRAEKASLVCYYLEQGMTEAEVIDKVVKEQYTGFLEEISQDLQNRSHRFRDSENTARIACFTENVQSKFMWDTYAGGYSGFALEYNLKEYQLKSLHKGRSVYVFPVIYSDMRPDLTREEANEYCFEKAKKEGWSSFLRPLLPTMDTNMLDPHKPFLYKDKEEYGHEKEWRLLYYDETNKNDFIEIPDEGCLKAIYYGMDIKKGDYEMLHKIAIRKGIKEYRVKIDDSSRKYSLKIEPQ